MRSSDSDIRAESCNTTPSLGGGGGGGVVVLYFILNILQQNIEIFRRTQCWILI